MFPKYPLMDQAGSDGAAGGGGTYTPPETPPKPGEDGYDEYMAYVGEHGIPGADDGTDGKPTGDASGDIGNAGEGKPQRPDYVPEKFWDAEKGEVNLEGLAKSYGELERARSQQGNEGSQNESNQQGDSAGINYEELGQRYLENGKLEDADYLALEKAGIPRDLVDTYLAGQNALAQATINAAYDAVGGKDKYNAMMQWARANKSEAELDTFDAQLTGDMPTVLTAVKAMSADYVKANGVAPNLIEGDGNVSGDVFRSQQEVVAAMSDPRYKNDPAYRASVHRKLAKNDPFAADAED